MFLPAHGIVRGGGLGQNLTTYMLGVDHSAIRCSSDAWSDEACQDSTRRAIQRPHGDQRCADIHFGTFAFSTSSSSSCRLTAGNTNESSSSSAKRPDSLRGW